MLNCAINVYGGEKHAYATLAVMAYLLEGIRIAYLWYDIGCRWFQSFCKWLDGQDTILKVLASDLQSPIPPMHVYAHK